MTAYCQVALATAALASTLVLASCAQHCEHTVAEDCASGGCPTSPDDRSTLCLPDARVFVQTCGDYIVVDQAGVDTGTKYYFDARTRELVATVDWSANFGGSETCTAGPDFFDEPDCSSSSSDVRAICPDAGLF